MPVRFNKVADNLYRGGAPQNWELTALKNNFGITKIISLDKNSGNQIKNTCKLMGLKHQIIPIHSVDNLRKELQILHGGVNNIIGDDICYVHCHHGKDRTGTFVAKYRVENGWDCKSAIEEALSFGFGQGLKHNVVAEYISCVVSACQQPHKHITINYALPTLGKTSLCDDCGYIIKKGLCNHCIITNALIKNASLFNQEIDNEDENDENDIAQNSREDTNMDNMGDIDREIGGGSVVSTIFNCGGNGTKARRKLIKNILLFNNLSATASEQKISFEIPEKEIQVANECVTFIKQFCEDVIFKIDSKNEKKDLFDIIFNPLNETQGITSEQAGKAKKFFDLFSQLLKNNLIQIQEGALQIIEKMEIFNSGSEVGTMISSLFETVENLNKESDMLIEILDDVDNKDFQKNTMSCIDILKKRGAQLKQLLSERFVQYLRKDVLQEDWSTEIKKEIAKDQKEQKEQKEDKDILNTTNHQPVPKK